MGLGLLAAVTGGGKSRDTEETGPYRPPHRGFTLALLPGAGVGQGGRNPRYACGKARGCLDSSLPPCGKQVGWASGVESGESDGWGHLLLPLPQQSRGFLLSSLTTGCSPAPGQDCVNSRHTVCRGLDLYKVVRLHQTRSGLQTDQDRTQPEED